MTEYLSKIRSSKKVNKVVFSISSFIFFFSILLLIFRAFNSPYPTLSLLTTFFYFTSQSNLLILLVTILYLLGHSKKNWFKNLSFISLVNIIITGLVFHIFLTPYIEHVTFTNQMLHTVTPIIYMIIYFIFLDFELPYKSVLITLIYPLIYMISVYLIIEPFFGNTLDLILPDFTGARYIYPFLDPRIYTNGFIGLLIFNLGLLAPLIIFLSLFIAYLKKLFDQNTHKNIS